MSSKNYSNKYKTKRNIRITIEEKKEIIAKHENGVRVTDLAKLFGIGKSTICNILKNKETIKRADVARGVTVITKQRSQTIEEVEKLLLIWVNEKQLAGDSVSTAIICEKAKKLHNDLLKKNPGTNADINVFKASRGWFEKFKRRSGIHCVVRNEEGAISNQEKVCADAIIKLNFSIGGEGKTVEIDETYVSKRKNNAGRILPPQWVFGGICRETKEVFLYAVPDRTEATLTDCIKAKIKPGTTIFSDCFSSYKNIHKLDGFHFIQKTVNHSKNFVDPNTFPHTQTIESTWDQFKYKNKKRCGTHRSMMDSYFCEFVWRQKHADEDLFKAILNDISTFSYI